MERGRTAHRDAPEVNDKSIGEYSRGGIAGRVQGRRDDLDGEFAQVPARGRNRNGAKNGIPVRWPVDR